MGLMHLFSAFIVFTPLWDVEGVGLFQGGVAMRGGDSDISTNLPSASMGLGSSERRGRRVLER